MRKSLTNHTSPANLAMQPTEAAQAIGVTPSTIRRWLAWHAAHLSADANPAPGGRRRLDGRDIEVLREVKRLRDEGLTTEQVNGRLGNIAIPDLPAPIVEASHAAPDGPQQAQTALAVIDAMQSALTPLAARIEAIEQAQQAQRLRVDVTIIAVAAFVAGLILGLAVWWFQ